MSWIIQSGLVGVGTVTSTGLPRRHASRHICEGLHWVGLWTYAGGIILIEFPGMGRRTLKESNTTPRVWVLDSIERRMLAKQEYSSPSASRLWADAASCFKLLPP